MHQSSNLKGHRCEGEMKSRTKDIKQEKQEAARVEVGVRDCDVK